MGKKKLCLNFVDSHTDGSQFDWSSEKIVCFLTYFSILFVLIVTRPGHPGPAAARSATFDSKEEIFIF